MKGQNQMHPFVYLICFVMAMAVAFICVAIFFTPYLLTLPQDQILGTIAIMTLFIGAAIFILAWLIVKKTGMANW